MRITILIGALIIAKALFPPFWEYYSEAAKGILYFVAGWMLVWDFLDFVRLILGR